MPDVSVRRLLQDALLWEPTGVDRYGAPSVGDVEELKVRWEVNRRQLRLKDGSTVTLEGDVFVDRDIPIGSHMWLGTLDDYYGSGSGDPAEDLCVVVEQDDAPDIRNRFHQKCVKVMRLHQH